MLHTLRKGHLAAKMAANDPLRNLKIKTGVVNRLVKERNMYILEVEEQEAKVAQMETDGKDEYVIKKQKEVLEESRQMIPDCNKRLEKAQVQLQDLVSQFQNDLCETDEYKAAQECLEQLAQ